MRYTTVEEHARLQNLVKNLEFESFKAKIDLAGLESEELQARFEAVDQYYNQECCYMSFMDPKNKGYRIEMLKRKELDIDREYNDHICYNVTGLDDLSMILLYFKMIEQQPYCKSAVLNAELIAYANLVKANLLNQTDAIQLTNNQ